MNELHTREKKKKVKKKKKKEKPAGRVKASSIKDARHGYSRFHNLATPCSYHPEHSYYKKTSRYYVDGAG